MNNEAHKGLSLAKRINDARDRVSVARETIEHDSETMDDIVTSTLVDHENGVSHAIKLANENMAALASLRKDFVALAKTVNVTFDAPPKANLDADTMMEIADTVISILRAIRAARAMAGEGESHADPH